MALRLVNRASLHSNPYPALHINSYADTHQYRHTYATWLLRRGAGMETVKECLGHASITTTIDTYGKSRSRTPARRWRLRAGSPGGRSSCDRC